MVQSSDADIRLDSLKVNAVMAPLCEWERKLIILLDEFICIKYLNKWRSKMNIVEDHNLTLIGYSISVQVCV